MKSLSQKDWQIPMHETHEFAPKKAQYCVIIPMINEGERFKKQLTTMHRLGLYKNADIIIADGGSTDGSTNHSFLNRKKVRTLLVKKDTGKLSAQLRMAYAYAVHQGYEGVITVDGNGKDSVESIPHFVKKLQAGYDMVQGSRFIKGGQAVNTPLSRLLAIRLIHAPFTTIIARRHIFTDTTNGFKAYSRRYLLHPQVQPFRNIFQTYELLAYLTVRASQLHMKVTEIPVTRSYPQGVVPTKIHGMGANLALLNILWKLFLGKYNPGKK